MAETGMMSCGRFAKDEILDYIADVDIAEADRALADLITDNLTCEPRLRSFLMAWAMCSPD